MARSTPSEFDPGSRGTQHRCRRIRKGLLRRALQSVGPDPGRWRRWRGGGGDHWCRRSREVYVAARDIQRASALAERIDRGAAVVPFGVGVSGALLVNATPLGKDGTSLPEAVTMTASGVVDLAYGADETHTVAVARAAGLPFVDGVEFLVLQAAASFEWWTGATAPIEAMVQAARNA